MIKGGRGLRKLRYGDKKRGKGTRGGFRIIYLHVPEVDWIFFLDGYSKDEQENLLPWQVEILGKLADSYRRLAMKHGRKNP